MTPVHIPSLRWALCAMLADTSYAEGEKDRTNVERRLAEAGWPEQTCTQLKVLALRWVSTQRADVQVSMRTALGEEISDEDAAVLPSHARRDSTHHALTTTLKGVAPMSIAYDDVSTIVVPKDSPMTELYGEPDWTELERQARLLEAPPWDQPYERVTQAVNAIKAGKVSLGVPATSLAYVQSADGKRRYTVREDDCTCRATHPCYHMMAAELYRLWQDKLAAPSLFPPAQTIEERLAEKPSESPTVARAPQDDLPPVSVPETPLAPQQHQKEGIPIPGLEVQTPAAPLPRRRPRVPTEYITEIKGKRHVQFAGLVVMAQEDGLATLAADWTYNDAELSLAHAVATFQDGRRYEESGDATPGNVTPMVKPHFRRVALTRAKARCLRDALGIEECAVEEVEEEADKRPVPTLSPAPASPAGQEASMPRSTPHLDLRADIWRLLQSQGRDFRGQREEARSYVLERTGLALEPANYEKILARLQQAKPVVADAL
jgi:hypothetical protein